MAKKKPVVEAIPEVINPTTLDELMGDRFDIYAKDVIQDRAIPDARDGMKPVQRRIISPPRSAPTSSVRSWVNTIPMATLPSTKPSSVCRRPGASAFLSSISKEITVRWMAMDPLPIVILKPVLPP